jgi:hypothetical protein
MKRFKEANGVILLSLSLCRDTKSLPIARLEIYHANACDARNETGVKSTNSGAESFQQSLTRTEIDRVESRTVTDATVKTIEHTASQLREAAASGDLAQARAEVG